MDENCFEVKVAYENRARQTELETQYLCRWVKGTNKF